MKEYVDKLIREYQEVWSVGRWNDANVKGTEPMGKVTTAGCGQLWLQLKNLECTLNKRLLHYPWRVFSIFICSLKVYHGSAGPYTLCTLRIRHKSYQMNSSSTLQMKNRLPALQLPCSQDSEPSCVILDPESIIMLSNFDLSVKVTALLLSNLISGRISTPFSRSSKDLRVFTI